MALVPIAEKRSEKLLRPAERIREALFIATAHANGKFGAPFLCVDSDYFDVPAARSTSLSVTERLFSQALSGMNSAKLWKLSAPVK